MNKTDNFQTCESQKLSLSGKVDAKTAIEMNSPL